MKSYFKPYIPIINLYNKNVYDIIDFIIILNNIEPKYNSRKEILNIILNDSEINSYIKKDYFDNYYITMPNNISNLSGFFSNIIEKSIKSIKKAGKKIQKEALDPIREGIKKFNPNLWKSIEKVDRRLGLTKNLKSFHKQLEKFTKKYGETIIKLAITTIATVYGGGIGGFGASTLLNMLDKLSEKQKNVLVKIENNQQVNTQEKEILDNILTNNLLLIQDEMAKYKDGEKDFKQILQEIEKFKIANKKMS